MTLHAITTRTRITFIFVESRRLDTDLLQAPSGKRYWEKTARRYEQCQMTDAMA